MLFGFRRSTPWLAGWLKSLSWSEDAPWLNAARTASTSPSVGADGCRTHGRLLRWERFRCLCVDRFLEQQVSDRRQCINVGRRRRVFGQQRIVAWRHLFDMRGCSLDVDQRSTQVLRELIIDSRTGCQIHRTGVLVATWPGGVERLEPLQDVLHDEQRQ